jgi:hypothetical protein
VIDTGLVGWHRSVLVAEDVGGPHERWWSSAFIPASTVGCSTMAP